jgi:hypothetical protein
MFSPSETWYIGSYSLQAPLGRSGWRMCTASCWPRGDTPKPFQRPADTGRNSAPLIGLRKRRRRVIAGGSNSPGICAATGWHLIRDEYSNYFQLILYNQHTIINLVSVSAPTSPEARSENRWAQNQGDLGENLLRISGTVRYGSQLRHRMWWWYVQHAQNLRMPNSCIFEPCPCLDGVQWTQSHMWPGCFILNV